MISSELPEVLGMSDRVLVMNGGRIVAAFDRAEATPEAVGAAMAARQLRGGGRLMSADSQPPLLRQALRLAPLRLAAYGQEIVIAWRIVVLFIVVGAVNPRFLGDTNLTSIFAGNAYIAVAAIGMSMVIISGHIDVSVGSLIGVLATICRHARGRRLSDLGRLARAHPRRHRGQRLRRACSSPTAASRRSS